MRRPYDVAEQRRFGRVQSTVPAPTGGGSSATHGQYDEPAEVFAWCGGSVLFRPAYLADVGLFDERFFLYYEDTDLSWRGRLRGWRYRTAPASVARHVHAATSSEGSPVFAYHVERNRLLMLVKNAPARLAAQQVWRYLLVTASYARRDIVATGSAGPSSPYAHGPATDRLLRRVSCGSSRRCSRSAGEVRRRRRDDRRRPAGMVGAQVSEPPGPVASPSVDGSRSSTRSGRRPGEGSPTPPGWPRP